MKIMNTRNDIYNWVDAATINWDNRTNAHVQAIADAIQSSNHPRWGTDWSNYLETLQLTKFLYIG